MASPNLKSTPKFHSFGIFMRKYHDKGTRIIVVFVHLVIKLWMAFSLFCKMWRQNITVLTRRNAYAEPNAVIILFIRTRGTIF